MKRYQTFAFCFLIVGVSLLVCAGTTSLFQPTELSTVSGGYADQDDFMEADDCGSCHERQYDEWQGSIHSRAHEDSIYSAFAELAREEGGDELYLFCSSCHAPGAIVTGEIPGREGINPSFLTSEGVTCDVCHSVKEVRPVHEGAGANASLVLDDESEVRYGPIKDPEEADVHESAYSEVHTKSMFCSACHTLTHPHNGLVIENTYHEWKESPYAERGVQCQDCHMRYVDQAQTVAQEREPMAVPGAAAEEGPVRANIFNHLFVGANVNHELTGSSEMHAREAEKRLKSAARIVLKLPDTVVAGQDVTFNVGVVNVGAGHAIPSSITELREVWIDLVISDADGDEIYRSGAIDETGRVDPHAVMYHSVLADKDGNVTHLPWRAVSVLKEKLIPPAGVVIEPYTVTVPDTVRGPLSVRAKLLYRSAPQNVMDELFGEGRFPIKIVEMAADEAIAEVK